MALTTFLPHASFSMATETGRHSAMAAATASWMWRRRAASSCPARVRIVAAHSTLGRLPERRTAAIPVAATPGSIPSTSPSNIRSGA